MNASKQNARTALQMLQKHAEATGCLPDNSKTLSFVKEFLQAAERKLPNEESYVKDAARRIE